MRDVAGDASIQVAELCTLTPHFQGPQHWRGENWKGVRLFAEIVRETQAVRKDFGKLSVVAFIMHQPRMREILGSMTGRNETEFEFKYSEGICLRADSLGAFLIGKSTEECSFRINEKVS